MKNARIISVAGLLTAAVSTMFAAAPADTRPAAGAAAATDPAAAPAAAPAAGGRRGRGGGGGGAAANVKIEPLANAEKVELTPPLDKMGNYKVFPKTTWAQVKGIEVKEGIPRGKLTAFQTPAAAPATAPAASAPAATAPEGAVAAVPGGGRAGGGRGRGGGGGRNCWVYVPAGYKEGTELPFMLDHDGSATAVVQTQLIAAMDILIAEKKIPMMGAVFVAPVNRSQEYDTVSGKYADYLESEVIPVAEKTGNVKFTKDPDGRGAIGQSSGSPAAMGMAWFHTPAFNRIISYSGSFTQIQKSTTAPKGAQEYQDSLIPNSEKKPIRIWMEVGSNDLNNQFGDWRVNNNNMANALKAKGYEYQFVWADGAGHVEGGVERQTMLEAMEWVWQTYKAK